MAETRHEGGVSYHIPGKDYFEQRELRRHAGVFALWALGVAAVISGVAGVVVAFVQILPRVMDQAPKESGNVATTLTGTWVGGTGLYKVEQEGERVVWDGIGRYGNKVWHHRGTGTITGDTISALIEELPDSSFPGIPGGARTEGTIASDGQTISWIGQNDQERIWYRK